MTHASCIYKSISHVISTRSGAYVAWLGLEENHIERTTIQESFFHVGSTWGLLKAKMTVINPPYSFLSFDLNSNNGNLRMYRGPSSLKRLNILTCLVLSKQVPHMWYGSTSLKNHSENRTSDRRIGLVFIIQVCDHN